MHRSKTLLRIGGRRMPRWFYFLLIFTVAAPLLSIFHVPQLLLFLIAGLGILPLAALIGQSVEEVAEYTGERVGGLLFATVGNAAELVISIFALIGVVVDVVWVSIVWLILVNAVVVL